MGRLYAGQAISDRGERGPEEVLLVLTNNGPGAALNIELESDKESASHRTVMALDEIFPVPNLPSGGRVKVPVVTTFAGPVGVHMTLRWQDGTGDRTAERHVPLVFG